MLCLLDRVFCAYCVLLQRSRLQVLQHVGLVWGCMSHHANRLHVCCDDAPVAGRRAGIICFSVVNTNWPGVAWPGCATSFFCCERHGLAATEPRLQHEFCEAVFAHTWSVLVAV